MDVIWLDTRVSSLERDCSQKTSVQRQDFISYVVVINVKLMEEISVCFIMGVQIITRHHDNEISKNFKQVTESLDCHSLSISRFLIFELMLRDWRDDLQRLGQNEEEIC